MSSGWQIALAGIGTYAFRASFVILLARVEQIPTRIEEGLRMIPPAVLGAIVAQGLVLDEGALRRPSIWHVAAALAGLVAWRTRSIIWCLGAGMSTLWLLSALT
jgi:branched-subunit amino acid transport protein